MKGTTTLGLPMASSRAPNRSLSTISNVRSSTTRYSLRKAASFRPIESRTDQRFSEAMQSSDVTGLPSCQRSPSRRVIVVVRPSSLTRQDSAICGLIWNVASMANSVS